MVKKPQKLKSGKDIPAYQFETLARCLLPKIQRYYESEDGKKEFEKRKTGQTKNEGE